MGLAALGLLGALVGPALAEEPPGSAPALPCTDAVDEAVQFSVEVDGQTATGRYALPSAAPTGLVVFSHGYGHTSSSWVEHMKRTATELGVIALAMDYRGIQVLSTNEDGIEKSRGWNVTAGAADGIAAAQAFQADCSLTGTIVAFGVSMGGNTSGLAVAAGPTRADGITPLFDWWVDVEGATNVIETYLGARALAATGNAFAVQAEEDIRAEMGVAFEDAPIAYNDRVVATKGALIAASGVKGVVLVHGAEDGLVPYDQSREMAAALAINEVPYEFHTVVLHSEDRDPSDTTVTGYVGPRVEPTYDSPLAGHASERSTTHPVMKTAFTALAEIYAGDGPTSTEEHVVNG